MPKIVSTAAENCRIPLVIEERHSCRGRHDKSDLDNDNVKSIGVPHDAD